jgi:hypothetical protein
LGVSELSVEDEKQYVNSVNETAKALWGLDAFKEVCEQIERTARAVYAVSNYELDIETEPVVQMNIPKGDE